MLNKYQLWFYVDGGRERGRVDCWGLVRFVLHDEFGLPLLPEFAGCMPDQKQLMTELADTIKPDFKCCEFESGAIAAHYSAKTLIHVGVVVENVVLHATKEGVICSKRFAFEQQAKTKYYRYAKRYN